MRLAALHIGNFKGLSQATTIDLAPLSFFVGANSSGKSTCIHALAALSQSLKLPNNTRAITFDDEFASVHLGRFTDAMHTKSYSDAITLGVRINDVDYGDLQESTGHRRVQVKTADLDARYSFRCTLRTQDVFVESAEIRIGSEDFNIRRSKKGAYHVNFSRFKRPMSLVRTGAFMFEVDTVSEDTYMAGYIFRQLQNVVSQALKNVRYLGPFRQPPLRRYPTRGSGPTEVGAQGEATITMLANEIIQSHKRRHIRQISKWLADLEIGNAIDISRVGTSDLF